MRMTRLVLGFLGVATFLFFGAWDSQDSTRNEIQVRKLGDKVLVLT